MLLSAGEWLAEVKRYETAVRLMRRAIESDFADASLHRYAFFFNFLNQCDWPGRLAYIERFSQLAEAKFAADDASFRVNPSIFVFLGADEHLLLRSAKHFARHSFPRRTPIGTARAPRSGGPLRVGYLSLFLSNHHIGYSQTEILKAYDPRKIEVYAYSLSRDNDPVQAAVKRHVAAFRAIDRPEPDAIARAIAADGVEVLVDLDGYVNGVDGLITVDAMSRRPAPVQMLFHNYVGPSGADFVDYVVGDSVLFPPGTDAVYSEKLIRLPPCYYPAAPFEIASRESRREDWELPEGVVVFANFGHFYKIEPDCFRLWMRIMRRVAGSVMWFNHWEQPTAVKNLRAAAAAHGVAPERLVFGSRADKRVHLERLRHADLFLDTLVYSSGVTSLDALCAGLPVLTVAGDSFARRVSASLNAGIGMEELTCRTAAEFEEKAVQIAQDPGERERIRAQLRAKRQTKPLFDQSVLARNLESAFLEAWSIHRSGAPPRAFAVSGHASVEPAV
jgi:predicted O-linked N-acetylglucosamine transferase (SPINDLY family)